MSNYYEEFNKEDSQNEKDKKNRNIILLSLAAVVLVISLLFYIFPTIRFSDQKITLFSPERLLLRIAGIKGYYSGRVLGNHVINTQYGEIKLKHFCIILCEHYATGWGAVLDVEMFETEQASHNLVIEDIEIPANVSITFDSSYTGQIISLSLDRHGKRQEGQEIIISGIPLNVHLIYTIPRPRQSYPADITLTSLRYRDGTEYSLILQDLTSIDIERFRGTLHIFKNEQWKLESSSFENPSIFVKHPGKNDFTRYRSIIFQPDWGEFIKGEVFAEVPDISEFRATHSTTMRLYLRQNPFFGAQIITELEENTKVQVIETRIIEYWTDGEPVLYVRVLCENGLTGWCRTDNKTSSYELGVLNTLIEL
ncbi:MAG: SH3 domain-containing protein [Treponema sp.]|nr:SH3 domain-containing protein [Treponema sp.]